MGSARLLWPVAAPSPPQPPALSLASSALSPPDDSGGRWTGGFTYAPHNHGAAWVRDPCDSSIEDVSAISAPAGVTATPSESGGGLGSATYSYKVTYVDPNGETTGSGTVTADISGTTGSVSIAFDMPTDYAARHITARIYGRDADTLGLIAQGLTTSPFIDTGAVEPGAVPPSSNTTGGPGSYANLDPVKHYPTLAVVMDQCSAFGWSARDFKGRVATLLDNATPKALGYEFFSGIQAQKMGYPNDYLTNHDTVTDLTPVSVPSVAKGIQILEDALAAAGFGGRGMLHVQPQTTPDLLNSRRVGNTLLSIRDNIIVADAGYTGYGPSNAVPSLGFAYVYATDLVSVRIDDKVSIFPDSFEEALDRGNAGAPNTIAFRAERFIAATWDGFAHYCCKVALAA